MTPEPRRLDGGFSTVDLAVVVVLTAVVVAGLSAMIEVPRLVVRQTERGGVDRADRTLAVLDRDIRYASHVEVRSPTEVVIRTADGSSITYAWDGDSGSPLIRRGGGTVVAVLERLESARFETQLTQVSSSSDRDPVPREAVAAQHVGARPGGSAVDRRAFSLAPGRHAGIGFVADFDAVAAGRSTAAPTTFACRLRRAGTHDLLVRIYEADAFDRPRYAQGWVASAYVRNEDLPTAVDEVRVPLTVFKDLSRGQTYFVRLQSSGFGVSAEIEHETIRDADASSQPDSSFVTSDDGGLSYSFPSGVPAGSQAAFKVEVEQLGATRVSSGARTIATAVKVRLSLQTAGGNETLRASFPILNNIARSSR